MYQNSDRRIPKTSLNAIFPKSGEKLCHENIVNGFRAAGFFPFSQDILPDEAFAPSPKLPIAAHSYEVKLH